MKLKKLRSISEIVHRIGVDVSRTGDYERGFKLIANVVDNFDDDLELWMFLPCDYEGNVLEKPVYDSDKDEVIFEAKYRAYEKAVNKILFANVVDNSKDLECDEDVKGYTVSGVPVFYIYNDETYHFEMDTFEDMVQYHRDYVLTEAGEKYFDYEK